MAAALGTSRQDGRRAVYNGMLTVLIDPVKLGTHEHFQSEAAAFVDWLRQCPPGAGFDAVQIAGEPERQARAARQRDGIVVDAATWDELVAAGRDGGREGRLKLHRVWCAALFCTY